MLQTFSGHIALPAAALSALLDDIRRLIDERFDGVVHKHWHTVLQLARKPGRIASTHSGG